MTTLRKVVSLQNDTYSVCFALNRLRFLIRYGCFNKSMENSLMQAIEVLPRNCILDFEREFCKSLHENLGLIPEKSYRGPFTRGNRHDIW